MTDQNGLDNLGDLKRSHDCGSLVVDFIGTRAVLMGWVERRRDLGALIFIELRDRGGITQVVFDRERDGELYSRAKTLRPEFVICVEGEVTKRADGQDNPEMKTGEVELLASRLHIFNRAQTPPILVHTEEDESDELRMRYRYIDLRRTRMLDNLKLRDNVVFTLRSALRKLGFLDVETPVLTRSTPEGARDFLVPSRLHHDRYYALPQSPQLFKQLLMVAGIDRYYQIVKCFRDEDFRADRQPEFTQLDLEMSFVTPEDVYEVIESLMREVFTLRDIAVPDPIPHMTYDEAMSRFGTDRPDLRNPLELIDVSEVVASSPFKVFSATVESGGAVLALHVPGGASWPRSTLDRLTEQARKSGAKGLVWLKCETGGSFKSPALKFIGEEGASALAQRSALDEGDALLLVADSLQTARSSLGEIRLTVGRELGLSRDDEHNFIWITHFPLLEYDEELGRHVAIHHPFTSPCEEDLERLETETLNVRARAYDLVVNGLEIGGGSIRIHRSDIQQRVFRLLGIDAEEAEAKFGFLLDALRYGAPPHGGIALGLDRLVMVLSGETSIREVIPFPKTTSGTCPLTGAPADVDSRQLDDLGLVQSESDE